MVKQSRLGAEKDDFGKIDAVERGAGTPAMDVYGDIGKMEELEILCPGVPTAARDGVSAYPGSGAAPESHDAVVLLGPGASSAAATNGGVACPGTLAAILSSDVPPATRNAMSYADWLKAQLSSSALSAAATNGVACPDALAATLTSDVPPETQNAVSYADWLKAQLSSGAPSAAATNGVACPDALAATLTSDVPPETLNAVSYTDWLTVLLRSGVASPTPRDGAVLMPQLSSGAAAPTPRNVVAYPDVLVPQLSPGAAAPTPRNAVAYPDVLVEPFGSTLPPATRSSASHAGVLTAHLGSPATWNAVGYDIGVHDGGGYDERSGTALPFAAPAVDGTDRDVLLADAAVAQVEVPGAAAERAGRGGLGDLGLAATALAVAGLTAGGTAAPATAMVLFVMLVAGVTLVTVRVFRRA